MSHKAQSISPVALNALKEALSQIYWYKNDLRSFLTQTIDNPALLASINWDDYKRTIVTKLVDFLGKHQATYQETLLSLMSNVIQMNNFNHLEHLEDGHRKATQARKAVQVLNNLYNSHETILDETRKIELRRHAAFQEQLKNTEIRNRLETLNHNFTKLATTTDSFQDRGFQLERLLKDLFELFDLDPRASFRCKGEQIDGAFSFENTDYLLEAKWQKEKVGLKELDAFAGKISRRLENTLGLFASINGYSDDAITKYGASGRSVMILIDGSHLMAVLEGRIDLFQLLLRLRRHAAQTGEIFLPIHRILSE